MNKGLGLEIEFCGITRATAAETLADYFHTTSSWTGGSYDEYKVLDATGRKWKIMRDASIAAAESYKCEFVTPVCTREDITTIQEIVRAFRAKGGKVNNSCGIHVHCDACDHNAKTLKNLAHLMTAIEPLLFKALGTEDDRKNRWCKVVDTDFVEKLDKKANLTMEDVKSIWYDGETWRASQHYDSTRYHALNLHAVWSKNTVEFRWFNSTLHAGKVKTYLQLALAINGLALSEARMMKSYVKHDDDTDLKHLMYRLHMVGEEFETARYHLRKGLRGCAETEE